LSLKRSTCTSGNRCDFIESIQVGLKGDFLLDCARIEKSADAIMLVTNTVANAAAISILFLILTSVPGNPAPSLRRIIRTSARWSRIFYHYIEMTSWGAMRKRLKAKWDSGSIGDANAIVRLDRQMKELKKKIRALEQ
jgi:hypothetical protein